MEKKQKNAQSAKKGEVRGSILDYGNRKKRVRFKRKDGEWVMKVMEMGMGCI